MSVLFSASEIVTMAIEVEKNGLDFYRAMASRAKDEKVKNIFSFLAVEEAQHKNTFQKLLKSLSPLELSHTEEAEYNNYLGALTSSRLFRADVNTDELIKGIDNDIQALDLAIGSEKESILFYYELREQTGGEDRETVDTIIKEEKMHLAKLVKLKMDLSN